MDDEEIKATLQHANDYLTHLTELNLDLDFAEHQVKRTSQETLKKIDKTFNTIVEDLTTTLLNRRDELLKKATLIAEKGVKPLLECRSLLTTKIENTNELITFGNNLLESRSLEEQTKFLSKSSLLGSLPEVPQLKEVPYLSFRYNPNKEAELKNLCKHFGSVVKIAPVQIQTICERPGALLVEWCSSDDRISDIQEYHLEKAYGNLVTKNVPCGNFDTCYVGSDVQYLVKDVPLGQDFTFRVCCKFEGKTQWSPWSVYQVGTTTLAPFCWKVNNEILLTNENKIAKPVNGPCMVFSDKTKFNVGYSVEFTFLECDINLKDTFIGLFTSDSISAFKISEVESVCVEASGSIYGSGVKKSTQFPPITSGTKVCFTCELEEKNKIRLNIDSSDKRVTYDWLVDSNTIYFGAKFNSDKWKILID